MIRGRISLFIKLIKRGIYLGKYKQKGNSKGSQKLIQILVNDYEQVFNSKLSGFINERISWVSPLKTDKYAEYRDKDFLEMLNLAKLAHELLEFWPRNGPQWDALGKFGENGVLLVEAKANIPELASPPSSAVNPISQQLITKSLNETKKYIGVKPDIDWTGTYYQYLNRLAHLYFLRVCHDIPAYLVMVYFIGDTTVDGPSSQKQWETAIEKMHKTLGIPENHPLGPYIIDMFIHVDELR